MKKLIPAATAALLLIAPGADAIPVLDQENTGAPYGSTGPSDYSYKWGVAQTFTIAVNGVLSAIEFQGNGDFSDRLDILSTEGGLPVGGTYSGSTGLGSVHTGVAQGGWVSYDVSALNISVSVGDVLAFKIWTVSNFSLNAYAGGNGYFFSKDDHVFNWDLLIFNSNPVDLIFRTYVEDGNAAPVPLPASGLLLGSIAVAGLMRGRRRMA